MLEEKNTESATSFIEVLQEIEGYISDPTRARVQLAIFNLRRVQKGQLSADELMQMWGVIK